MSDKQRIFIKLSEQYIKDFATKHGLEFDGWVGVGTEHIGTVAEFNEATIIVSYDNIRYDIDNNIHPDKFGLWYDCNKKINFINFCKWE